MANPQKENGYTAIANEICDKLRSTDISKGESKILWTVLRATYGWNKKQDNISISQFQKETGMSRWGVCKACTSLVNRCLLGRQRNGTTLVTTYYIQKDLDKWCASQPKEPSQQPLTRASQPTRNQLVNGGTPTKDITKDNINTAPFDFEALWAQYPRRLGKKDALRHFKASVKTQADWEAIQRALVNYKASKEVQGGFVKHGSGWFNNWRDYENWQEPILNKTKDPMAGKRELGE